MQKPDFGNETPRPSGGTMPMSEIGNTGIRVSQFGFGAHMTPELAQKPQNRQKMIREAAELGISFFDVYDHSYNWWVHQYGPMGQHLKPFINDVVISTNMAPKGILTVEQEMERMLMLFGRDYIDMVRCHSTTPEKATWGHWDKLFKLKEQGKIRAVGLPIHYPDEADIVIEQYPIDYVILPYNFYHNLLWNSNFAGNMCPLGKRLREKGIGIVTMKPFGTDWFVTPLIKAGRKVDESGEVRVAQAMLKWVLNSELNPDAVLGGMYNLNHVYENIAACYDYELTAEEQKVLGRIREVANVNAQAWLPGRYRFLNDGWAPEGRLALMAANGNPHDSEMQQ
jgi:aryl-alcohol dehydrogenase-like predicted oxidoreductase